MARIKSAAPEAQQFNQQQKLTSQIGLNKVPTQKSNKKHEKTNTNTLSGPANGPETQNYKTNNIKETLKAENKKKDSQTKKRKNTKKR